MYKIIICILLISFVDIQNISALIQEFYWRDYIPGYIPPDALEGGKGRYIGQTYQGGFLPGTIYPFFNVLVLESSGKKVHSINIKILCTNYPERFYWDKVNLSNPISNQMDHGVIGGYQVNLLQNLYIGRIFLDGEWRIGKVVSPFHPHKGLWVWNTVGSAHKTSEFELLKYNYTIIDPDGSVLYEN